MSIHSPSNGGDRSDIASIFQNGNVKSAGKLSRLLLGSGSHSGAGSTLLPSFSHAKDPQPITVPDNVLSPHAAVAKAQLTLSVETSRVGRGSGSRAMSQIGGFDSSNKVLGQAHSPKNSTAASQAAKVLNEIVSSEEAYVAHLETFMNVIVAPMMLSSLDADAEPRLDLKVDQVREICSNIEELYGIACKFANEIRSTKELSNLELRIAGFAFFADKYAPAFKNYAMYASNCQHAKETLEELRNSSYHTRFQAFLENAASSAACKGNTMDSYLIMPVQRLPRYVLLLKQLLKEIEILPPTEFLKQAVALVQSALKKLEDSASSVNEAVRMRENGEMLAKIQKELGDYNLFVPGRVFIRRSKLNLVSSWNPKTEVVVAQEHEVFLFSDMLMFTTMSGFFTAVISVVEFKLDSCCVCEVVADASGNATTLPLLRIGLPYNCPFPLFGPMPIMIEFPSHSSMFEWTLSIEEVIRKCPKPAWNRDSSSVCSPRPRFDLFADWMEGDLLKLDIRGEWTMYFFFLENNVLSCYTDEDDFLNNAAPLGQYSMSCCFFNFAAEDKYQYPALELTAPEAHGNFHVFGAETKAELVKWAEFIKISSSRALDQGTRMPSSA